MENKAKKLEGILDNLLNKLDKRYNKIDEDRFLKLMGYAESNFKFKFIGEYSIRYTKIMSKYNNHGKEKK